MDQPPSDLEIDFLAQLDLDIKKLTRKSTLQSDEKRLKDKLRDRRVPDLIKSSLRTDLAAVQAQLALIQWRPEASVAMFVEQHCDNCASIHSIFTQHMQRQISTSGHPVKRWVRVPRPEPGLPREVIKQLTTTHCCSDCITEFGFDMTSAEIKFSDHSEPYSVSQNYLQEDMNDGISE